MAIVILANPIKAVAIRKQLSALTDRNVVLPEEVKSEESIQYAVIWKYPPKNLSKYKNLALICSFGAGVDHIFSGNSSEKEALPKVPIIRIGDAGLAQDMSRYIITALGYWEQRIHDYRKFQIQKQWNPKRARKQPLVGILGLGVLGKYVAKDLVHLGYRVKGYSLSSKYLEDVETYTGQDKWDAFLMDVECLICLLPLTKQSRGIVNFSVLKKLKAGGMLINVARGGVLVENDVLKALNSDMLSLAFLDVFDEEPLPVEHPFWEHPNILITPHVAALTNVELACQQIVENIERQENGRPLMFEVDKQKGY